MRILYLLLIIFLSQTFILSSCERTADFEFLQKSEKISKIEVVVVGEIYDPNTKHELSLINEIPYNDINNFINDFKKVECSDILGDPKTLFTGDKGFKIIYKNGDYEIITYYAQGSHSKGKYYSSEGYYYFDEEQFNDLIEKYSY